MDERKKDGQEINRHGHRHHHHHHHHHHQRRHQQQNHHEKSTEQSIPASDNFDENKQSAAIIGRSGQPPVSLLEEQIQVKTQALVDSGTAVVGPAAGSAKSSSKSAQEFVNELDARIEAKLAEKSPDSENHTHSHVEVNPDNELRLHGADNINIDESKDGGELLLDKSDNEDEDERGLEGGCYYPETQLDRNIMAEIGQEGLVDEVGGIEAFIAEPAVDEANVIGIIKSDEEIESEERRQFGRFFIGAVTCIVAGIVIIGVPVTLKLTNIIGEDVLTPSPTISPSFVPSKSPSSMPSSIQFTEVVEKLYNLSGKMVQVFGSPHHSAARWITDIDQMDYNDPRFEQRYIMALFYFSMNGPNWKDKDGWLSKESECTWAGVEGPMCNDGCIDGKVCGIKMGHANGLKGQLPREIGLLTEMRYFEVQSDGLFGTLPLSLGNWKMLDALLLNWNGGLEGGLDILQNNELLGTIFVNGNQFNGTLDFLVTINNLEWFEASENSIGGTLPEDVTNLKHLRILNVNNNSMTGHLPDTWDDTTLIEELKVTENYFKGPLPTSLGEAKFLKDLHLSHNQLTGSLPVSYYNLENLEELVVHENNMVGELPQAAELFYDGLQKFSIHSNNFEGHFPVEHFESANLLKVLSLHRNHLTGTITEAICDMLDPSNPMKKLTDLSVDCDLIGCDCCTCYENGTLVN